MFYICILIKNNNNIKIITFILSIVICFFVSKFIKWKNFDFLKKKQNIASKRFSLQSKPIFGGVNFFIIFILLIVLEFFTNGFEIEKESICLLLVGIVAFAMGLADDILNTSPYFKFLMQIFCTLIFIFSGTFIEFSSYNWCNYLITGFWVVGIMNSFNMLDNMDGVSGFTALSIFGGIIFYSLFFDTVLLNFEITILIGLSAALLFFLFYNWYRSEMYMGDNGSQFIGATLAYFGIRFFTNNVEINYTNNSFNFIQIIILISAFIIPITDTTSVTINRLMKKKSPFCGDKNHTTHHLFYLGIPIKIIGPILFFLNLIGVISAFILLNNSQNISYQQTLLFLIYPFIVFVLLYLNTKITKEK